MAESRRQVGLWGRSAVGQQGTAYPMLYLTDEDPGTEDQLPCKRLCQESKPTAVPAVLCPCKRGPRVGGLFLKHKPSLLAK